MPQDEQKTRAARQRMIDTRRRSGRPTWAEADAINTGRTQEGPRRVKAAASLVDGPDQRAMARAARTPLQRVVEDVVTPVAKAIGSLRRRDPALKARATTEDQLAREKDVRADAYDDLGIVRASVARRRPAKTDGTAAAAP